MKKIKSKIISIPSALCILILICLGVWFWMLHGKQTAHYETPEETSNVYVRFDMEAYDTIKNNFWEELSDAQLSSLYQLALEKAANVADEPLASSTRAATAVMLDTAFKQSTDATAEKNLALNTLEVLLYDGLPPVGHDNLQSTTQETKMNNEIDNINPNTNLYQNLGLQSGASIPQVNQAYTQEMTMLQGTTSPQGLAQIKQVTYAHGVLMSTSTKEEYDGTKVEPTIFSHVINFHTLYLYISKIAPTTIQEFLQVMDNASTTSGLTNLIIDVRGNPGGELSFAQNAMSLFVGPHQYVFDLYNQGNYLVQRTPNAGPLPSLSQYKEIAILTNGMTQSTAELTASVFRRYRLAYIVGTKTAGWGSAENEFPLKTVIDPTQQFSLLLVQYLTLGDNQQPIEANGVTPDVDTSTAGWQNELSNYFNSSSMLSALKQEATAAPLQ